MITERAMWRLLTCRTLNHNTSKHTLWTHTLCYNYRCGRCSWIVCAPSHTPHDSHTHRSVLCVYGSDSLFLSDFILPAGCFQVCPPVWPLMSPYLDLFFSRTCWGFNLQLVHFNNAQQLTCIGAAAAVCAVSPSKRRRGFGNHLPGLPQSAHVSLPGLASTSCRSRLFPSGSSAMVSLSVQPHRGAREPAQEHPTPERDSPVTCQLPRECEEEEKERQQRNRREDTERFELRLEENLSPPSLLLSPAAITQRY